MTLWKRILKTIFLLSVMKITLVTAGLNQLTAAAGLSSSGRTALGIALRLILYSAAAGGFVMLEILPCWEKGLNARLQILAGGYELILLSIYALAAELGVILLLRRFYRLSFAHIAVACLVLMLHYLNGFWRTAFCSAQLGAGRRVVMFFFWWLFPVNLILFYKWCAVVRRELLAAKNKYLLDLTRVENAVCRTRYPVVMVHGIFFRDWQYMNYWGRIPKALKRNGAAVYYGHQQSSLAVADSAAELKGEIEKVLAETGAEKVNIVAHSKGGLDSRYAISRLGLADRVASLTTVNTPHRGCQFADALLGSLPKWLIHYVAARYNTLFRVLGDQAPDFLAGVTDLTAAACAKFNEKVPDAPGVYYQSVMSKMSSHRSSFFPLSLSYFLVKKYEGENDGLVSVSSAPWGNNLGLLQLGKGGKGISHADMIDLTHHDIKGFDACEFYVKLFEGLKKNGF